MGGAGVWARSQGGGLLQVLATVSVALMVLRGSSAYLLVRHCQVHQDCSPGEYCQNHQECHCQKDFVREPGGACLAVRRAGEPCTLDEQCSRVDAHLVCYNGRCHCPHGIKMANGTCFHFFDPRPPTPPAFLGSAGHSSDQPRKIRSKENDNVVVPTLILLLTFLSLTVLLVPSIYVRARRHWRARMAEARVGGDNLHSPRRVSLTSIIDNPPSYSSLPPPSYEQATEQATGVQSTDIPLTARRRESYVEEPLTMPSDVSSGASYYGSPLARTSQPSTGFSSLTDLTPPTEHEANRASNHRERY